MTRFESFVADSMEMGDEALMKMFSDEVEHYSEMGEG